METIRVIIRLNNRYCRPYCWLPIEKGPAVRVIFETCPETFKSKPYLPLTANIHRRSVKLKLLIPGFYCKVKLSTTLDSSCEKYTYASFLTAIYNNHYSYLSKRLPEIVTFPSTALPTLYTLQSLSFKGNIEFHRLKQITEFCRSLNSME